MADKKFGVKRVCSNCSVKFYDLNAKSPLTCPHCEAEIIIDDELNNMSNFQVSQNSRKPQTKDEFADLENADETTDDNAEEDVISLDEAAVEESPDSKN